MMPGQQVVEVVRDAAGELADGLHLLGLAQGLLRLLQPGLFAQPLRHVRDELIGADGSAPSVAQVRNRIS